MEETSPTSVKSLVSQDSFQELQERATKDALSGLLNRITVEQYVQKRLAALGDGEMCALLIVDLDDFKRVNDTLGHLAGDHAVRQTAQMLSGLFRAKDVLGRLGGDEFIAFLSGDVTEASVQMKGQEICQALQLTLGNAPGITITASVGICIASGRNLNFDHLYQAADLALYKAKKNGKHGFYIQYGQENREGRFLQVNTIPLTGLLEHMESAVVLLELSQDIRILYVSPSFCRIVGIDLDGYTLPRPLSTLVHPDDLPGLDQMLRDCLAGKQPAGHTHRISADGQRWIWMHIRASHIDYDNPYPVMLVTATDISEFKSRELRAQQVIQQLQTAFEQTTQSLWEVDMGSRVFSSFNHGYAHRVIHEDFPGGLLRSGWVHPDSIPRFQEFAQELLKGRMQGYGNFILRHKGTGAYGWAVMSYRMICDDAGQPLKAVGVFEHLPQGAAGQMDRTILARPMPHALIPYLTLGLRANLTQDTVHTLWLEGKNYSSQGREESCNGTLQAEAEKIFSFDERKNLERYFDREALLALFAQGERWIRLEYRRVDGGGDIRWVRHIVNMSQSVQGQDVFLFVYLVEIPGRKREEAALGQRRVRDADTGLYTPGITRGLVEGYLSQASGEECALAILQMGEAKWFRAPSGVGRHTNGYYVASALSVAIDPACILGLYNQGRLLVFFPQLRSRTEVKRHIEEAFAFVRLALADTLPLDALRFVAGIACAPASSDGFSSMSAQGARLCQMWQNAPSDTVALPQEGEDWFWGEMQRTKRDDLITVHHTEMDRPLSEGEKDVALRCVSAMLSAESMDASIRSVLSYIGAYYRADRVYVLTLAENRHVVTMPYEWISQKKHSIQQAVSGMLLERFPLLKRCLEERAPIFLTRSMSSPLDDGKGEIWHFTTLPLVEEGNIIGFLCIENSRDHPADAALFSTLIPYIVREQKRFHARLQMPGDNAGVFLSDMPNLRSYMNIIYSLNSEVYSSLGAVCLDIPGLSAINSNLGFEYGSKLLWYVSKTLTDIFGRSFLFRTWDAEFVALCPDTTRQVFLGRCTRLRTMLQRRYPRRLRIGYSWSEGVFTGRDLVNEARAIMRCERVEAAEDILDREDVAPDQSIQLSRFLLYLQPKVHMPTGRLLGAEALVRGVDPSGQLISPDHFIKQMEKDGTIRDLDLFVLDHALSLMERWRTRGLALVPLSVNFSRRTLFDPTAPASVLAIQSRYPMIPPHMLEMEVTESGVSVDWQSLDDALERFRVFGIRLSLDDFGSEYANISIFTNVKFDSVKLDRSLIAQLPNNPKGQMLVRDLVSICHTYGMICVAEGVENRTQIAALTQAGCGYGQGYYFDRPMSAQDFEKKYLRPVGHESALARSGEASFTGSPGKAVHCEEASSTGSPGGAVHCEEDTI